MTDEEKLPQEIMVRAYQLGERLGVIDTNRYNVE